MQVGIFNNAVGQWTLIADKLAWSVKWVYENKTKLCDVSKLNYPDAPYVEDIVDIDTAIPVDLVVGSPDCSGVSKAFSQTTVNNPKNKNIIGFIDIVCKVKPNYFMLENVPGLLFPRNRQLDPNNRTFGR